MSRYFSFNPNVKTPVSPLPGNSCDCHFHVFGDPARYPILPGVEHVQPQADVHAMLALHAKLGIGRGTIISTTAHGHDHTILLDALKVAGANYRGCALGTALLDAEDGFLQMLDSAGVKGARCGFLKEVGRGFPPDQIDRAVDRCRELGWYLKIQPDYHVPLESLALLDHIDIPVIIDHLGRCGPADGIDGPIMRKLTSLLAKGNFWLVLSNGYKVSGMRKDWDDVIPYLRRFIDLAPDRLIWGTDWPHTFHSTPVPDDGELVDFLIRATDDDERQKILVETPADLFGFGEIA